MKRKIAGAIVAACFICLAAFAVACDNHKHSYETTVVQPTCVGRGYTRHTCTECGKFYDDTFVDALSPTLMHDYGEWTVTLKDTAFTAGERERECSICHDIQKEELAPASSEYTVKFDVNSKYMGTLRGNISQSLKYGSVTSQVTAKPNTGYKFIGWSNGNTSATISFSPEKDTELTAIFEPQSYGLPIMFVETENEALPQDKKTYIKSGISLMNAGEKYSFDSASAGIRLRGNSTLTMPKKPYRIKFDEKTSPFGWPKNKSWALLALYEDVSNMKGYAAFTIAGAVNKDSGAFAPHARHVELYINGEYQGLYLLTDQTDENKGRTGVKEDFAADAEEVPFLVEWDENVQNEGVENTDWFKIENSDTNVTGYYEVKYPEADERQTQAQFDYVKNYVTKVNSMCHNPNVTRAEFEQYVDLGAFIDYYLVQEIMGQQEINKKSIFMSKKVGGKLVMGPVWDFDWAAGGPMSFQNGQYSPSTLGISSSSNWFGCLLKAPWFKQAVTDRLKEVDTIVRAELVKMRAFKAELTPAALRNAEKWDLSEQYPNLLPFSEYYDWVMKYIEDRLYWIPEYLQYK